MQANALQFDLFGQHMPMFMRAIPKKSSIEDVCNIISNRVSVETVSAQVETVKPLPTHIFGIDVKHPTNTFERILAEQVKRFFSSPMESISVSEEDDDEILHASGEEEDEEEAGSGIVGVHKKILKVSLKDLKANRDTHQICMWVMDGKERHRPFSFEACCALSEINPDSLRDNLLTAGLIPHRYVQ